MSTFVLSVNACKYTFSSCEDALKAADVVQGLTGGRFQTSVEKVIPPLNGYHVDDGDRYVIGFLVDRRDVVPAIKFVRNKSNAGLKEAKDWVEANF